MADYKFPSIKLFIDGKEVKAPLRNYLASLEVSESIEQIDMMEARFTIPPASKAKTDVLKLAKHGAKMKVQMCAAGAPKRTLEGMIIEVGYSGAGSKAIELTQRGLSDLTKVKGSSHASVHKGNDAAVVKKIAEAAGLGGKVEGVA